MTARHLQTESPTRPKNWLRIFIPATLILIWLALAAIGGPYFGRVSEVSSNEQANYLPTSAESTKVQGLYAAFSDEEALPAIVVFTAEEKFSEDQIEAISAEIEKLPALEGVSEELSPGIPSEDGLALQAFVPVDVEADIGTVVTDISKELRQAVPDAAEVHVTGPAGFTADLVDAFEIGRASCRERMEVWVVAGD